MSEFIWKPISEIPTEHWNKNPAISPLYLVKCNGMMRDSEQPIIGYSRYSFATNQWMDCVYAIQSGVWNVVAWSNIRL